MKQWKEISAEEITSNAFHLIGKEWGLVAAGTNEKVNTMTISWGGVGIMWGKPVAYLFIRPQRYTKQFIDQEEVLSLSFYNEEYREMLSFMGTKSGKDIDKINEMHLTTAFDDKVPFFEEANMVFFLKKLYKQDMTKDCLIENEIHDKWYSANDYHTMYVCEITKVLVE